MDQHAPQLAAGHADALHGGKLVAADEDGGHQGVDEVQHPRHPEDDPQQVSHQADGGLGALGRLPGGLGRGIGHRGVHVVHIVFQKVGHGLLLVLGHVKGILVHRGFVVDLGVDTGGQVEVQAIPAHFHGTIAGKANLLIIPIDGRLG